VVWLCLICGWIASLLIIWGQRLICHHECLALLLYLVEGHKFPFVAKTFHVSNMNDEDTTSTSTPAAPSPTLAPAALHPRIHDARGGTPFAGRPSP
jgi:hypothetical protein